MTQRITATSIQAMAEIIADVKKEGYQVVSGRRVDTGVWAFYALTRNRLTDELEDVYFVAKRKRDGFSGYYYNPIEADEYFND